MDERRRTKEDHQRALVAVELAVVVVLADSATVGAAQTTATACRGAIVTAALMDATARSTIPAFTSSEPPQCLSLPAPML